MGKSTTQVETNNRKGLAEETPQCIDVEIGLVDMVADSGNGDCNWGVDGIFLDYNGWWKWLGEIGIAPLSSTCCSMLC